MKLELVVFSNLLNNFQCLCQFLAGHHLDYTIECAEEFSAIKVPKIILQPIVENAIYHGIKELDGVGFIKIQVEKNEHQLILKVSDNGVGFDSNTQKSTLTKLGGVGIDNVNKRLKLIYGDESGVRIESEIGVGTIVTIIIPEDKAHLNTNNAYGHISLLMTPVNMPMSFYDLVQSIDPVNNRT